MVKAKHLTRSPPAGGRWPRFRRSEPSSTWSGEARLWSLPSSKGEESEESAAGGLRAGG